MPLLHQVTYVKRRQTRIHKVDKCALLELRRLGVHRPFVSDPRSLRYVPELCPDVVFKRRGEGGDEDMMPDLERTTVNEHEILVNACARGGGCPFCHSTEEYLYHPLKYKVGRCTGALHSTHVHKVHG